MQVEIAGTKALADLAQKNKNNRVRIAEREESIPAIMQQLVKVCQISHAKMCVLKILRVSKNERNSEREDGFCLLVRPLTM